MKRKIETKYRHPGFYRIKPYGFEHRSLSANMLNNLEELLEFSFKLLNEVSS